jgi:hypothetical protein
MHVKRPGAVGRARYLRENRTTAESKVWRWLRGRKLIRQKNAFDPLVVSVERTEGFFCTKAACTAIARVVLLADDVR